MRIGSACAGIGGIDLGLERAGLGRTVWQIEKDLFCRDVLAAHWPDVSRYDDVKTAQPGECDILCAGFPCQPVSVAGKRLAQEDPRWLWPDVVRLIRECRPSICIFENVPGLRTAGLRDVLADLAALGLDAEWTHFRASQLGAPHHRNRWWCVATDPLRVRVRYEPGWLSGAIWTATTVSGRIPADPEGERKSRDGSEGQEESGGRVGSDRGLPANNTNRVRRLQSAIRLAEERGWSDLCGWRFDPAAGVDDGLSGDMGKARKALGNAVVVHCAHLVGLIVKAAIA